MKHLYQVGRLFLLSEWMPSGYQPFLLPNVSYDEQTNQAKDENGQLMKLPEVLSFDFVAGEKFCGDASQKIELPTFTILKTDEGWVYKTKSERNWLQISADYSQAVYHVGSWTVDGEPFLCEELINMAVQCRLVRMGYLVVHAACVQIHDQAILFSAPSGTGKSTRAMLWVTEFGASLLSGDRPAIDPMRGTALGVPWDGKEGIHCKKELPIAAFNRLSRAEKTKLSCMTEKEKNAFLATQTFMPMWDPTLVGRAFSGIRQMIRNVPVYSLACDRTAEAARECHNILFPRQPETVLELLSQLKARDVPRTDWKGHVDRFLDNKARKQGIPFHGTFELTPLCNLNCKMCYVHLGEAKLLEVEHWKQLMKAAHEAGMRMATLTGGECLTYPGFNELYLYLQSLGVEITVFSNGLLLDESRIAFFKQHPAREIQVTLYGSSEEAYEKVTGVRCFERVYRNIICAREAGLPLRLAITPNAFGWEDMPALLQTVKRMKIPYHLNPGLSEPRKETGRTLHDLTDEQYLAVYRINAEMQSPVDPTELPDPPENGKETHGIRSGAGRSCFAITWNGLLVPCGSLTALGESIGKQTFAEVWQRINQKANELQTPGACVDCAYRKICIPCVAQHYDPQIPGNCNRAVCRRTRLLAENGFLNIK